MSNKNKVDWSNIEDALPKPKRLRLKKDKADSSYYCPIQECQHEGFQSQRGCKKHVHKKHSWFLYFDEKPALNKSADDFFEDAKEKQESHSADDTSSSTGKIFKRFISFVFSFWSNRGNMDKVADRERRGLLERSASSTECE